MPNSAYKVVELIGTSQTSWEDAARNAVAAASSSLKHLRVAEVKELDLVLNEDGTIEAFRTKVTVSFKYEA